MSSLTLNPNYEYYNSNSGGRFVVQNDGSKKVLTYVPRETRPQEDVYMAAAGAAGALGLAQWGIKALSTICSAALMAGKEFASAEDVKKTANAMKKENGLRADIHYLDQTNVSGFKQKFPQLAKNLDVVARGSNAFYTNKENFACAPKSKPSLILHELGHATNFEKSSVMRGLQKLRVVGMIAPMAITYLNRAAGERSDGKKNFWERNAGTIGFCAFLPTIIEEGAASIRGINAAKKTLGAGAKLGTLKKNYFLAWMTYVLAGIGTGIAAKLAINND